MEAKFTRGPYLCRGRYVCGQRDGLQIWSAYVDPCKPAIDTAELEAVETLFWASPLLYEALEALHAVQNGPPLIRDAIVWQEAMDKAEAALRAARGEK